MASTQNLLRSQRDVLLEWLKQNPAPLLRWLYDAGVLTREQYISMLERSNSNAVAATLEVVCAKEESSQHFLQVLKDVQDYYCVKLQTWVEQNCKDTPGLSKKEAAPVKQEAPLAAHKNTVLNQTQRLMCYSEGGEKDFNSSLHIEVRYTDLFVTEDNDSGIDSTRHEYFTLASRRSRIYAHQACRRISPCQLFSPQEPAGRPPKRVKVKGIAGIGKSIAMQRLMYEWALGKDMRNFACVFDLRFRELNLIDAPLSFQDLLGSRFLYLRDVLPDILSLPDKVLFILDGLDEFKYLLDWNSKDKEMNLETKLPVSELILALIRGSLLPESSVILTTRPSTDAPKELFQRCCVVLGFEEMQVKQYTSKFYKDQQVAEKVYNYIIGNDNLFVLSFIPLYCYIICTAMAEFFSEGKKEKNGENSLELNPPKTVSEVYYYYLFTAVKHHALKGKAERYTRRSEVLRLVRDQLINLGKLAYENLLRSKILFERKDLERFGIEPQEIRSTFLSQILVSVKEEKVEMFAFFHLTVQEHLAALYCVISLPNQEDVLRALDFWSFGELLPSATHPPLISNNEHLEHIQVENLQMFTRFFMGLIRSKLKGMLDGLTPDTLEKQGDLDFLIQLGLWFQQQFKEREISNQTALNLLHCLMELHMQETTSRVAPEIKKVNLFKMKLSVVDCAALQYVLQFSSSNLEELNLGYSNIGNRGLLKLGSILHRCESLYLRYNCLDKSAAILESAVLKSKDCQVKKLFMCGNNLGPEGVLALWTALEQNSTVEELYLDITGITEKGTENIVNCLSKNTTLKTLTIVGNDIGEVGKKRLRELERHRPELRIIGNFVDDLGLLKAYLGWVDEMKADQEQRDSVKNADALVSVLKGLRVTGTEVKAENAATAKELETKILELLKLFPDLN
ncbi:NLR family CARD domain-containing protein 3-like [Chanos chanos]|uniref:NLR family CARD domain-containing protein 3-like n=1 Tax=Chanos chanos TaxID=29144 RepID=A0A6J2W166_CHACN|nr:NLR family CARD domain-containing protein 3-like [Chanos chanos]